MTPPRISRNTLHRALDDLLDAADANGGRIAMDAFWEFVAGLAQGRGITEELHEAGIEALRGVNPSPAKTFNERQTRAYHIGLLLHFLMAVGRLQGQASVLPANFQHGVVAGDLLGMLRGPAGLGEGDPQMLTSARTGQAGLRRAARLRLVQVVHWRIGDTGATRERVWFDLMGDHADKTMLDRWQKEAGGADGPHCRAAREAGARGDTATPWAASNQELTPVIKLALSGPGRHAQEPV